MLLWQVLLSPVHRVMPILPHILYFITRIIHGRQSQYSIMPMPPFYVDHSHLHTLLESLTSISAAGRIGFPPKSIHILTQNSNSKPKGQSLHLGSFKFIYFEIKMTFRWKPTSVLSVGGRSLLIDLLQGASSKRNIHGPINYKDKKTKCRHYWRFIKFIDRSDHLVMLVFSTHLCELLLSNLLSGSPSPHHHTTPPPPFPK